jgi:hypothetical protein
MTPTRRIAIAVVAFEFYYWLEAQPPAPFAPHLPVRPRTGPIR